jgi:hypothetical protein
MRLIRTLAVITSGAAAFAAIGVVALAVPASANSAIDHLCVDDPGSGLGWQCAWSGDEPLGFKALGTASGTNWHYPTAGTGQISQAGTNLCMTINVENNIVEGTCQGASDEEWTAIGAGTSEYNYQNPSSGLCLAADLNTDIVVAAKCDTSSWSQVWAIKPPT